MKLQTLSHHWVTHHKIFCLHSQLQRQHSDRAGAALPPTSWVFKNQMADKKVLEGAGKAGGDVRLSLAEQSTTAPANTRLPGQRKALAATNY